VSFEAMWSFQSFLVSRRGIKPATRVCGYRWSAKR
jgi:hypothetical protein